MDSNRNLNAADEALALALSALDDDALPIEDRLELFRRAAKKLDDSKADIVKRAAAWNGIGVCLYRAQAGSKAEEEAFSHSLNLLRRSPDGAHGEFAASVLSNLGECCLRAGKRERAHELYGQALDELRAGLAKPGCSERYAICACARAQCADGKEARDELRVQAHRLRRAARDRSYYRAVGLLRSVESAMLCRDGKPRKAVRRLRTALRMYIRSGASASELSEIYVHLSKAELAASRVESALEDMNVSIELLLSDFPLPGDMLYFELASRLLTLAGMCEQLGQLEDAAKYYSYSANFFACCENEYIGSDCIAEREGLTHYLCASCMCRMRAPLYYDAMIHYSASLRALAKCSSFEAEMHRRLVLSARADVYEAFGENELAAADYTA